VDEEESADVYDELRAAVELPAPYELIDQLERAVDSEPLTRDDIHEGRVRVLANARARSLLPTRGSEVNAELVGSNVAFRVKLSAGEREAYELICFHDDRREFHAVLDIEEGRILRVAPTPDGVLRLD
jgi:hypothetical protein